MQHCRYFYVQSSDIIIEIADSHIQLKLKCKLILKYAKRYIKTKSLSVLNGSSNVMRKNKNYRKRYKTN